MNAANTVYRAGTIKHKRRRRTQDELAQLDLQILAELRADHPQSVRHVFYRMTDPRLPEPVEKSQRGYRHVQDRCVKLRRNGSVPYGWISDATRRGYFTNTYANAAEFIHCMSGFYRADLWAQAEQRCEVWVESRSLAGVVEDDCTELAVNLFPAGGFSSITFAHDAANGINANYEEDGRATTVFYIGDYDPAGVLIDVALERELREHLEPDVPLNFERIGITEEQVQDYDLPTKPRKPGDRRSMHVHYSVEAEAMPAHIMRKLLRDRIEALLPAQALAVAKAAEADERAHLQRMASMLEGSP